MPFTLTPVQARAIDPQRSIWLTAHAGTGKTKVLVDRILRLLLQGEAPSSVLALTYTKAAAAEMQTRLRAIVKDWSAMDDAELSAQLRAIGCLDAANASLMQRARSLFLESIDGAQPLQIQTIHSFCQTLLSRFPLEAGVPMGAAVIDEMQAKQLLNEAKQRLLQNIYSQSDEALIASAESIMCAMGDQTVQQLLSELVNRAQWLSAEFATEQQRSNLMQSLAECLEGCTLSEQDWLAQKPLDDDTLFAISSALMEGTKTDIETAMRIDEWLAKRDVNDYFEAYLTTEFTPRKRLMTNAIAERFPYLLEQMQREQQWALCAYEGLQNRRVYLLSMSAVMLAFALIDQYEQIKARQGAMDYNDVIAATHRLLSQQGVCEWVLTKLDMQLNHILLDEAQDTSPELWRLLQRLVDELFVPELYVHSPRSLFVVGDKKQSIFRFQGADPIGFSRNESYYRGWFAQSNQPFESLTLGMSFRSCAAVLDVVDSFCRLDAVRTALLEQQVQHELHRKQHYGCVQLWPLVRYEASEKPLPPWQCLGQHDSSEASAQQQLANAIASDIAERIAQGTARAGDVMVLVQTRTKLVRKISQALIASGVAVAGVDRLSLSQHLAVQEVMAAARWCLLESDDLSLAETLKGSLLRWDDDMLFALAYNRSASLWDALQASDAEHCRAAVKLLAPLQKMAQQASAYEWLCALLDGGGLRFALLQQFGMEAEDALRELKEQLLLFEEQNIPHLQMWLEWLEQSDITIKRELPQGIDAVRIMTVHAAKGLQAPIVYLPDTLRRMQYKDRTLCCEYNGQPLMLVPPVGSKSKVLQSIKKAQLEQEVHESLRLLYVALTRAESELIICGVEKANAMPKECWYAYMQQTLEALGVEQNEQGMMRYETGEQKVAASRLAKGSVTQTQVLPAWLNAAAPSCEMPAAMQIMSPSELLAYAPQEGARESAAESGQAARERGTLLHRLLQCLPPHKPNEALLLRALKQIAPEAITDADAASLVQTALRIWQRHSDLFAPHTRAEVSLHGQVLWQGKQVWLRGQIDLLIEQPQRWLIVDYKSNSNVPDSIPQPYLVQLAAYRALLMPLAVGKPIDAAILWTQNGELVMANNAQLDSLCQVVAPLLDSPAA